MQGAAGLGVLAPRQGGSAHDPQVGAVQCACAASHAEVGGGSAALSSSSATFPRLNPRCATDPGALCRDLGGLAEDARALASVLASCSGDARADAEAAALGQVLREGATEAEALAQRLRTSSAGCATALLLEAQMELRSLQRLVADARGRLDGPVLSPRRADHSPGASSMAECSRIAQHSERAAFASTWPRAPTPPRPLSARAAPSAALQRQGEPQDRLRGELRSAAAAESRAAALASDAGALLAALGGGAPSRPAAALRRELAAIWRDFDAARGRLGALRGEASLLAAHGEEGGAGARLVGALEGEVAEVEALGRSLRRLADSARQLPDDSAAVVRAGSCVAAAPSRAATPSLRSSSPCASSRFAENGAAAGWRDGFVDRARQAGGALPAAGVGSEARESVDAWAIDEAGLWDALQQRIGEVHSAQERLQELGGSIAHLLGSCDRSPRRPMRDEEATKWGLARALLTEASLQRLVAQAQESWSSVGTGNFAGVDRLLQQGAVRASGTPPLSPRAAPAGARLGPPASTLLGTQEIRRAPPGAGDAAPSGAALGGGCAAEGRAALVEELQRSIAEVEVAQQRLRGSAGDARRAMQAISASAFPMHSSVPGVGTLEEGLQRGATVAVEVEAQLREAVAEASTVLRAAASGQPHGAHDADDSRVACHLRECLMEAGLTSLTLQRLTAVALGGPSDEGRGTAEGEPVAPRPAAATARPAIERATGAEQAVGSSGAAVASAAVGAGAHEHPGDAPSAGARRVGGDGSSRFHDLTGCHVGDAQSPALAEWPRVRLGDRPASPRALQAALGPASPWGVAPPGGAGGSRGAALAEEARSRLDRLASEASALLASPRAVDVSRSIEEATLKSGLRRGLLEAESLAQRCGALADEALFAEPSPRSGPVAGASGADGCAQVRELRTVLADAAARAASLEALLARASAVFQADDVGTAPAAARGGGPTSPPMWRCESVSFGASGATAPPRLPSGAPLPSSWLLPCGPWSHLSGVVTPTSSGGPCAAGGRVGALAAPAFAGFGSCEERSRAMASFHGPVSC